jgi:hypothetical protein
MRKKLELCLLLSAVITLHTAAQSIYSFQYNFQSEADKINYYAFLLKNNNGSGLLRIRFENPVTNDPVVIEMDTDEQFALDTTGNEDTTTLLLKGINPRFKAGNFKSKYTAPVFTFTYNSVTDYFDPSGVTDNERRPELPSTVSFTWQLMEGAALNKNFVAQFFSEDEDFYTNLFQPLTRGLSATEKNIQFHLLIVADTLDKFIGPDCANDMKRALETFQALTDYLGIKFFPKTICGKEYSKASVQSAIANLKPRQNDIVVFYYTGHGFRIPEKPRPFPNLKLKNFKNLRENFRDSMSWIKKDRQDNITYSLNIEDIFYTIKKKGARFNLVLSDCCNNDIFGTNAQARKPGKTKGSGVEWNEDNIRTLFLNNNPMSILATAAQSGERATSNHSFGSFFSYFFKQSLEDYCSKLKKNPTWDQVFQMARLQTTVQAVQTYCDAPRIPENKCRQNPDYRVFMGR